MTTDHTKNEVSHSIKEPKNMETAIHEFTHDQSVVIHTLDNVKAKIQNHDDCITNLQSDIINLRRIVEYFNSKIKALGEATTALQAGLLGKSNAIEAMDMRIQEYVNTTDKCMRLTTDALMYHSRKIHMLEQKMVTT